MTYFTLQGKPLSAREIDALDKYDLMRAFFETVENGRKSGARDAEWFAAQCVNNAAECGGKPKPFKL